jgi:hypothetical protein
MSASHSRAADSTGVSSTVCRSKVERLITLSTSAVAVCCCRDSLRSAMPARSYGRCISLEDAPHNGTVREHVEIIVVPLAGRPTKRRPLEEQIVFVHYRAAPALLGSQQPQFSGLTPHFLDRASMSPKMR